MITAEVGLELFKQSSCKRGQPLFRFAHRLRGKGDLRTRLVFKTV